ncbi:MAG: aminotransferase [Rhizobiales bacterium NRL2]|jgi:dTDP-4-amino-4,6-dideoxygalactose transaminase|nr:MAG: aminotransferase [Rhizobiales bacterium NRL2]
MITDLQPLLIEAKSTIREAMAQLNTASSGCLLLVDGNGALRRMITDGDLRRAVIAGHALDADLTVLEPVEPTVARRGLDEDGARRIMRERQVVHLPVLDETGRPIGLYHLGRMSAPILLSAPHMGETEQALVAEAFATNWIAPVGPHVDAFERELAETVEASEAVALSSGTAAIHLALRLLGVRRGDRVYCSSLTFVASANPILYEGAEPVFIDSEPESWNMSPAALERALEADRRAGRKPAAVIVVNIYGQSADMAPILDLCDAHDVPVIEDAAESLGARYRNRASGTLGRLGVYSFNGNKIITTSGGGALVGGDREMMAEARRLATQARDPASHYQHSTIGFNYRLSNVLAGIGRGQLKALDDRVARRRAIFERYREGLGDLPGVGWMPEPEWSRSNRWLSVITLDPDRTDRHPYAIMRLLRQRNIETRPVWKPMHLQPLFRGADYFTHSERQSVSDRLFLTGLCLPSGTGMTDDEQGRVIDALTEAVAI